MKKILIIATALLSISAFAQKGGLDEATLKALPPTKHCAMQ